MPTGRPIAHGDENASGRKRTKRDVEDKATRNETPNAMGEAPETERSVRKDEVRTALLPWNVAGI